jgi:predicted RNase H-like nuclease (RuvC/YqgF family)
MENGEKMAPVTNNEGEIIGEQIHLEGKELALETNDIAEMNVVQLNESLAELHSKILTSKLTDEELTAIQEKINTLEAELAEKESQTPIAA